MQVCPEPLSRALDIPGMGGIAAEAGDAKQLMKLVSKPFRMAARIIACFIA
jgi:hypothetical protein